MTQALDEPADDQPRDEQDAERKRDPVEDETRATELVTAPPFDEDEKRQKRERDSRRAQ